MVDRAAAADRYFRQTEDTYIRDVAGTATEQQLATAKSLLDSGAISEDEYRILEAKARR
jgi:hypothetical protein